MYIAYLVAVILALAGAIAMPLRFRPEPGEDGRSHRKAIRRALKYGLILLIVWIAMLIWMPKVKLVGWMSTVDTLLGWLVGVTMSIFAFAAIVSLVDARDLPEGGIYDWLADAQGRLARMQSTTFKIVIGSVALMFAGSLLVSFLPEITAPAEESNAASTTHEGAPLPTEVVELPKEAKCDGILDAAGGAALNWQGMNPAPTHEFPGSSVQVCVAQGWAPWPHPVSFQAPVLATGDGKADTTWVYYHVEYGKKQWVIRQKRP